MSGSDHYEVRNLKFENEHAFFVAFNRFQTVASTARRSMQKNLYKATAPAPKDKQ